MSTKYKSCLLPLNETSIFFLQLNIRNYITLKMGQMLMRKKKQKSTYRHSKSKADLNNYPILAEMLRQLKERHEELLEKAKSQLTKMHQREKIIFLQKSPSK